MPSQTTPSNDAARSEAEASSPNDFLTVKESAARLRVSKSYLDKLRVYGGGPPFMRLGKRKILYAVADLNAWASSRRHGSTSEYAG